MKMCELAFSEVEQAINSSHGLGIQIASIRVRVHSAIPQVAQNIYNLYSYYPTELEPNFSDFSVHVYPASGLRRWFRAQVHFALDEFVPFKPLPLNQAYAFFEWGLNWCVAQYLNNALILHAAVVEKNGKAAILPAPPGSGKSTLCALLVASGWRLLSDEMAIIDLRNGSLKPLPRPISLKNESINIIQSFAPKIYVSPTTHDTNKGSVAHMQVPLVSAQAANQTCEAGWFILPKYQPNAAARLEPMTPGLALMAAIDNSFNYSVQGAPAFHTLTQLLTQLPAYRFSYSDSNEALAVFSRLSSSKREQPL